MLILTHNNGNIIDKNNRVLNKITFSIDVENNKGINIMNSHIFQEMMKHDELREILEHELFLSMSNFRHHDQMNCLTHTIEVAKITYMLARKKNLDYISATRGALLHDFYLYNWPTESPGLHGLRHPSISLKNARANFDLNHIEEDAILRHMFPITPMPPRYPESRLVSWADKKATYHDYRKSMRIRFNNLGKRIRRPSFKFRRNKRIA